HGAFHAPYFTGLIPCPNGGSLHSPLQMTWRHDFAKSHDPPPRFVVLTLHVSRGSSKRYWLSGQACGSIRRIDWPCLKGIRIRHEKFHSGPALRLALSRSSRHLVRLRSFRGGAVELQLHCHLSDPQGHWVREEPASLGRRYDQVDRARAPASH